MTGSTRDLILISLVMVILLAAWIVLVFYADAHPEWRREDPARHGTADQAARPPGGRSATRTPRPNRRGHHHRRHGTRECPASGHPPSTPT